MIALGRVALDYLLRYRETFAPGVPIIVCYWTGATPATIASLSNVTGVFSEFNWSKTFALAARLQPEAREVAIVSGASVPVWEEDAHRQLAPHLGPYKVRYLAGLPYDTLLDEVAHLPRDTIVLILPIFKDGDGVSRIPARAAADVAQASSAPTYAPIDTFLGTGLVGGYMDLFEASGSAAAELAIEVLGRKDTTVLPSPITTPHNFVVDARQLQRWGLSQSSLPIGTKLMFKQPTLWEQYRNLVLITVAVFAVLVACLVTLSLQVLKRRRAEATLEASEERMKFTAASTDTGLWQYDIPTRHMWATEYCRSMFGFNADSPLTPEAFLGAVHPDDRAVVIAAIRAVTRKGATAGSSEFRVVRPDGQPRWYLATASTEFDKNGEPIRVSGIFRDVTSRKKAEQESKQLEDALRVTRRELARVSRQTTIGAMAASIAHEINQPGSTRKIPGEHLRYCSRSPSTCSR
jgi:PAS domain S-box-containing protein